MTDSMFSTLSRARHYPVEEVRSIHRLREYLEPERLFAAYALAQLEPDAFPHARWFICPHDLGVSLVCHSRAGLGDATFTLGPADGVAAILSIQPGQPLTFATAKPQHLTALEEAYTLTGARQMRRLHVSRQTFQAAPFTATHDVSLLRLRGHQVRTLNRLYGSEGGPTSYQPHHVDEGCYYGVVERGRLVAVAGTHAISPSHGIAVVGNVFTHPQHRGRGYATIATSATTRDLLRSCNDVVLSVDPDNLPAVGAYESLGYVDAGDIVEAAARRRVSGLTVLTRRLLATARGRGLGAAIVRR